MRRLCAPIPILFALALTLVGCFGKFEPKTFEEIQLELLASQIAKVNAGKQDFILFLESRNTDLLLDVLVNDVHELERIRSMEFVVSDLTNNGLTKLAALPSLTRLTIDGGNGVSELGLEATVAFPKLKFLKIVNLLTTTRVFEIALRIDSLESMCIGMNPQSVIDRPFTNDARIDIAKSKMRELVLVHAPFDGSKREYLQHELGDILLFRDEIPEPWPDSWSSELQKGN